MIIAELEARTSDDPSLTIQIELMKRENALLEALERALTGHASAADSAQDNGSAKYGH